MKKTFYFGRKSGKGIYMELGFIYTVTKHAFSIGLPRISLYIHKNRTTAIILSIAIFLFGFEITIGRR